MAADQTPHSAPRLVVGVHDFDRAEVERAGPDTAFRCGHCGLPFYKSQEVIRAR